MRLEVHASVEQVPATWDSIAPRDRVTLETRHLRAIERAGVNDLVPYYIVGYEQARATGIAHCFAMDMDLAFLQKDLPAPAVATLRAWHPDFLRLRLLECGMVAALGEGMAGLNGDFVGLARLAGREMERIARHENASFILIRDVPTARLGEYASLIDDGFVPLMGFPMATLPLRWGSFDDYLGALKSDARWRLRRHLERESRGLTVETLTGDSANAARLAELWHKTHARAKDYSHELLTEAYFAEIGQQLGVASRLVTVKKQGQIVAFCLCFVGEQEYSAHHAGIDYGLADEHNLYFVLLLAILQDALASGAKTLSMGITTYDPKFMLGCEAQPLVYLIKHVAQPQLSLALAHSFQEVIPQPDNMHRPFKGQDVSARPLLSTLAATLRKAVDAHSNDAFGKVWAYDRINKFRLAGLYTFYPPFESAQGPTLLFKGKPVIMLGSNAYTGLATHPEVVDAARAAIDKYGTGCSGSPLLNGTLDIHVDLARALADFMGKEDALLFSTGYQTNVGVVSALMGKDDVLVMDRLDHASLVDGGRLAHAEVARFRHNDIASLEQALARFPDRGKFVVVDSVFSMEGTVADLPAIVRLVEKYGARLMVDEAHAMGVLGPGGRGASELCGVLDKVDVVMGTFSKSFAAIGGFVAGDARVIDYLRHVGRSHIFSASLPPSAVATVRAALEIIKREPERRARTLANAQFMSERLQELGYQAPYRGTAIVPVHCGHELLAFGLFKKLLDEGVFVNPVAEPAVPRGRELLRTSYMATHTEEMLERAVAVFARLRTESFPKRAAVAVSAPVTPALNVRPMVLLPVADRSSFSRYYGSDSTRGILKVPGFTHLEVGDPVDCGISFGEEGMLMQSQGLVVSKCATPQADNPPGIEVELLPTETRARDLIQRLLAGQDAPPNRRQCWRYHACFDVHFSAEGATRTGTVDDISLEGAAIRSSPALASGSHVALRLMAPLGAPVDVAGEVRWHREGDVPAFGVQFQFGSASDRESIQALIGTIQTAIAGPIAAEMNAP